MVQPPLKAGPASKLEQTCIHIEILIMLSRHYGVFFSWWEDIREFIELFSCFLI